MTPGSSPLPTTRPRERGAQPVDDLVEASARNVEPLDRHADLARGHERRRGEPLERRLVERRVVEDDRRVVASELERDARQVRRRHPHDPLAAADAAGEADVPDARIADDDRADARRRRR